MVYTGGAADATVVLLPLIGRLTLASNLTANTTYYRSSTGTLTSTRPSMSSSTIIPLLIGTTDAAGNLVCNKQRLQRRMHTYFTPTAASRTITVGFPISHVRAQLMGYNGTTHFQFTDGYYDVLAGTQVSVNSNTALLYANVGAGTTNCIYTGSVNGSNDLVLTWSGNSLSGVSMALLEIFEDL